MSEFTKAFKIADEDLSYAETTARKIEEWLDVLDLDPVNNEYVIKVEVIKL
jgi:hypothetical protein